MNSDLQRSLDAWRAKHPRWPAKPRAVVILEAMVERGQILAGGKPSSSPGTPEALRYFRAQSYPADLYVRHALARADWHPDLTLAEREAIALLAGGQSAGQRHACMR